MRESRLEQKIKEYVESRGGLFLKWTSPGFTGVPDRIAFLPGGKVYFVEVKRPGRENGLSPRQKRVIDQLESLGQTVIVANKLEDIYEYL